LMAPSAGGWSSTGWTTTWVSQTMRVLILPDL